MNSKNQERRQGYIDMTWYKPNTVQQAVNTDVAEKPQITEDKYDIMSKEQRQEAETAKQEAVGALAKAIKKTEEKKMTEEVEKTTQKGDNYFERKIVFSNYRNLGIGEKTELVINKTSNDGIIGELILVIGANNAGKTGVLHGVSSLVDRIDKVRDTPGFVFDTPDTYVRLKLVSGENDWACVVRPDGIVNVYEGNREVTIGRPKYQMSAQLENFLNSQQLDDVRRTMKLRRFVDNHVLQQVRQRVCNTISNYQMQNLLLNELNTSREVV